MSTTAAQWDPVVLSDRGPGGARYPAVSGLNAIDITVRRLVHVGRESYVGALVDGAFGRIPSAALVHVHVDPPQPTGATLIVFGLRPSRPTA